MTDRPQGVKVYYTGSGYGEAMNMSEGFTFDTLQKEFPGIYLGESVPIRLSLPAYVSSVCVSLCIPPSSLCCESDSTLYRVTSACCAVRVRASLNVRHSPHSALQA